MKTELLQKAVAISDEIDIVENQLKEWSLVKIGEYEPMPASDINMWSPGGVLSRYRVNPIHAEAIKKLHVDHYTEYLASLKAELEAL